MTPHREGTVTIVLVAALLAPAAISTMAPAPASEDTDRPSIARTRPSGPSSAPERIAGADAPAGGVAILPPDTAERLESGGQIPVDLGGPVGEVTMALDRDPVLPDGVRPVALDGDGSPRPVARPDVATYSGQLLEVPGSVVRIAVDDRVRGYILLPSGQMLWFEPSDGGTVEVVPVASLGSPAPVQEASLDGDAMPGRREGPADRPVDTTGAAEGVPLELRMAIEGDYWFWYHHSSPQEDSWQDYMAIAVHFLEGITVSQLQTKVRVTWMGAWTEQDPYYTPELCGSEDTRITRFRDHWEQERSDIPRDVAHLLTGLPGTSSIGCAYTRELGTPLAYAVTNWNPLGDALFTYLKLNVFSHEVGHNFGGLHGRSLHAYRTAGTLMSPGPPVPTPVLTLDNRMPMRSYAENRLSPLATGS